MAYRRSDDCQYRSAALSSTPVAAFVIAPDRASGDPVRDTKTGSPSLFESELLSIQSTLTLRAVIHQADFLVVSRSSGRTLPSPSFENMHEPRQLVDVPARLKIGKLTTFAARNPRSSLASITIDRETIGFGRLADNQDDQFTPRSDRYLRVRTYCRQRLATFSRDTAWLAYSDG